MSVEADRAARSPQVPFDVSDCSVFARYPERRSWSAATVSVEDQEKFRSVRARLKDLAGWVAEATATTVRLKGFVSTLNPNGRTPEDMWCCVFPSSAPNKSYTLQVALIISAGGAELCFCLGSGTSQLREPDAGVQYLQALQQKLRSVPESVVSAVSEALPSDVKYLTAWRRPTGASEFGDLRGWLSHAGGEGGTQASISRYFSPDELEAMGEGIADAFVEMANAAAPLLEYCFPSSTLEPETDAEASADVDEEPPGVMFDLDTLRARASAAPHHLLIDDGVYRALIAAVQSGKHVVLTGPPGTAKTTLAEVLCQLAADAGQCLGHTLTTATADWTTYETIGGLRPAGGGFELEFRPGLFLEAASTGRWLIVDELNRSNFDRAFGQLFTVLSGQSVVLPYEDRKTGKRIVLALDGVERTYQHDEYTIVAVPRDWRIIATMNVFDKSLLFEMSYALMRRFAFVEVPAPGKAVYETIWRRELLGLPATDVERIGNVLDGLESLRSIKQIGPAVFKDMARFARQYVGVGPGHPTEDLAFQLFYSFLLPQFEGIDGNDGRKLFRLLAPLVGTSNRDRLRTSLREVLGVTFAAGNYAIADGSDDELEDGLQAPNQPV